MSQQQDDGGSVFPSGTSKFDDAAFDLKPEYYRIKPEPRTLSPWICVESYSSFLVGDIRVGPLPIDRNSQWERITVQEVLQ